jgi:hypothetical protein
MENILIYQEGTETIRQMPQNYMIATRTVNGWVCDPDPAADFELVKRVFNEIFINHESKWGEGLNLLSKVTPNSHFTYMLNSVGVKVKVIGDYSHPKNTVQIEYEDGHREQRFVEQLTGL